MSIHRPLIIAALPTVFGGASDALEAALRFECAREDFHSYEVRLQKDGCAVAVYSESPRWQEGFLAEAPWSIYDPAGAFVAAFLTEDEAAKFLDESPLIDQVAKVAGEYSLEGPPDDEEGEPLGVAPPSLGAALETGYAHALDVVAKWSAGDLAGAVNGLEEWAEELPRLFPDLEFTEFEGDDA